jgi:hypothetical protein
MGLKSLPMLNKSNVAQYWQNIWNYQLRYNKSFLFSIYIYNFFSLLLNSKKILLLNKKKEIFFIKDIDKKRKLKKNIIFYFGRSWIMSYDNWVVIFVRLLIKTNKKWIFNSKQSLIKIFIFNIKHKLLNNTNKMNNKYM